jgi:hypothetical protein
VCPCYRELMKYERAIHEDYFSDAHGNKDIVNHRASRGRWLPQQPRSLQGWAHPWSGRGRAISPAAVCALGRQQRWDQGSSLSHATCRSRNRTAQALRYSRTAATVRACAYKLEPNLRGGDLPFVGDVTGKASREARV